MSRVAKAPVVIPAGVTVTVEQQNITVKGKSATLSLNVHPLVSVKVENNEILFSPVDESVAANAQAGTARANVNNMVVGVDKGYEKKLTLVGVGYRLQVKGNVVNLNLGFSHPIDYELPEGVTATSPSQTELVLKSANKCLLGQVAADIRSFRAPEPYKGKGVRYADEIVHIKEAKKK